MKSTGIIRGLDNMGRVVIPKEIRKFLDMTEGEDAIEIYMQDDCIVLKKHKPSCIFCSNEDDCIEFVLRYSLFRKEIKRYDKKTFEEIKNCH